MMPQTYDVRKAAHLLSDDRLARVIAERLVANDVTTPVQADDLAEIADETRDALFGNQYADDVAEELNDKISEITRPNGLVYRELDALSNGVGYTLCTKTVKRKVTTSTGVEIIVSKQGRFVTSHADVAALFRVRPQVLRLERTMERLSDMMTEDTRRIPGLSTYTPVLIGRARATMDRTLPAPKQNGSTP